MKLSKVTVLVIILIGVTLLFALLGSLNIKPSVEGFTDDTLGCSGEIVPKCHDKVLHFAGYDDDAADDYILKTQVVVPTCPTCPSYHEDADIKPVYSEGVAANAGDANGDSDKVDDDAYKQQKWEDTHKDEGNLEEERQRDNSPPRPTPPAAPATYIEAPAPQAPAPQAPQAPQVGLAGSATPMTATPAPVSTPAPANQDTPPCPACERCPEPAFECKKVPNYRSPSMQNYMPIPVLNDFSKF
jgi:hypothetical protein